MVGRFESPELLRDATTYESQVAQQGLLQRCLCVLGLFVTAVGIVATINNLGGLLSRNPRLELEVQSRQGEYSDPSSWARETSRYGLDPYGEPSHLRDEPARLGVDFSLVALLITVTALFVLPPMLRPREVSWSNWGSVSQPWGDGFGGTGGSLLGSAMGGPQGFDAGTGGTGLGRGLTGRVIDVKPGELRGGPGAGGLGSWWSGRGLGWGTGFGHSGLQGGWSGVAGGEATPDWSGSWGSQVPTNTGLHSFGLNRFWPGSGGGTGTGFMSSWERYGGHGHGHDDGGWGSLGSPNSLGSRLPTEAEVTETYQVHGVELQQWVQGIASLLEREVLHPLLTMLDDSDKLWQQALAQRGMRLSFEAPRLSSGYGPSMGLTGPVGLNLGAGGLGSGELSVFESNLPRPLCDDPQAVELWEKRKKLESFLIHPSFEPAQRSYVLEKLRGWRDRGILTSLRNEQRLVPGMTPTDAHLLENLVVKMLNCHLEFARCFMASGQAPPSSRHQGQPTVAYMRQVTDQSQMPKPPPHYEVVTTQKTWKLRPGNSNVLEALALLLYWLRKQAPRSYKSFPQSLQNLLETQAAMGGLFSRPLGSWFAGSPGW